MLKINRLWEKRPSAIRAIFLGFFAVALLIMLWGITTPHKLTNLERDAKDQSSLNAIIHNPIFAPWKILENLVLQVNNHTVAALRLPSVIFGILFAICFYFILRGWFGRPIAYLTTGFLVTTPLYLLLARSGSYEVLYFAPILLMAAYTLANRKEELNTRLRLIFVIALAVCLYVPGMVWLVAAALIMNWRGMRRIFSGLSKPGIGMLILLFLILISPIIYALINNVSLVKPYLLIPAHVVSAKILLKKWAWGLLALVYRSPSHETLMLDRIAILDAAQIGLAIFGCYVMWDRLRKQFFWIIGFSLLVALMSALNNSYYVLALSVGLIIILVGMGLRYLFIEWMYIFPRNPIPRYFAIILMASIVLIQMMYGIRYAVVAWPHNMETNSSVVVK